MVLRDVLTVQLLFVTLLLRTTAFLGLKAAATPYEQASSAARYNSRLLCLLGMVEGRGYEEERSFGIGMHRAADILEGSSVLDAVQDCVPARSRHAMLHSLPSCSRLWSR